jgi:hypothetical protein
MQRTEHPQNTTPLSAQARTALLGIADRLTGRRPTGTIDDARRRAMALTFATDAAGYLTEASDALEQELLAHMPEIERHSSITRGEYALKLRAAATA